MASAVRRIATWLLLASYLFAVTAASSLHDHGNCGHDAKHHHSIADARDTVGASPRGDARAALGRDGFALVHSPDDACPVCQFLAQKFAPVRPAVQIRIEALPCDAIVARSLPAASRPLSVHHSRAPPPVA
jgi:hypothetical protein